MHCTRSAAEGKPRRRPPYDRRLAAKAEEERRRKTFQNLPAFAIDAEAKLTTETRRQADALFSRLQLKGYKLNEKRQFWHRLFNAAKLAHHHAGCVMYPRNSNHPEWSSIRQQVIDAAVLAGLFRDTRSRPGWSSHMSRLIPTPQLAEYVEADPWAFDPDATPPVPVELRDSETDLSITFDRENPAIAPVVRRLERVNAINAQYRIECKVEDAWGNVTTRQLRPFHFAIFHDDWGRHGRIYTGKYGHQNLSKIERSTITFDGEPSIELDYSGLHPRMIYHLKGIDFRHDPYRLWGRKTTADLRYIAKMVLNAAINARDRRTALSACNLAMRSKSKAGGWKTGKALHKAIQLREALRRTRVSFAEAYDKAQEKHRPIADKFGSGAGTELMSLDGKIALDVIYHFAKRSIPCLGVHDSWIVPKHAESKLRETMMNVYERKLGFLPVVPEESDCFDFHPPLFLSQQPTNPTTTHNQTKEAHGPLTK